MSKVPKRLIQAINNILELYGEKYVPGAAAQTPAPVAGCLSTKDACAYLGVSKSTMWRIVKSGALTPIRLNKSASNGATVFARADLDAYIASCR